MSISFWTCPNTLGPFLSLVLEWYLPRKGYHYRFQGLHLPGIGSLLTVRFLLLNWSTANSLESKEKQESVRDHSSEPLKAYPSPSLRRDAVSLPRREGEERDF